MEFLLTLRRRGIADQAVLRAMDEVPRERFVEPAFADSAYADQALPIACGQTISQPYVVAYMTEQLNDGVATIVCWRSAPGPVIRPRSCRASCARSGERSSAIAPSPRRRGHRLKALGYENVEIVAGDGFAGVPDRAPYDRIIVTAAAETVPEALARSACRRRHHDPAARLPRWVTTHYQAYQVGKRELRRENLIPVRFCAHVARAKRRNCSAARGLSENQRSFQESRARRYCRVKLRRHPLVNY